MIETQPPQSTRPRTAVPKRRTVRMRTTEPSSGWPMTSEPTSGSRRRLMNLGPTTLYMPGGYELTHGADCLSGFFLFTYWRRPVAGRSSEAPMLSSHTSSSEMRSQSSSIMSLAYSLENLVGSSTQGPAKPDLSVWQRPYACPPHSSTTASRSVKPMRPNTSRMCCARLRQPFGRPSESTPGARPVLGLGRRPLGGHWSGPLASTRPPRKGMTGPPVCSMAA
mmetsp:Transcript_4019/g.11388  ORF Transcript_4019/g.11388 Transcript_4019/m.11388 type:complete len:222 (-) Transcript_4019:303-968(-)